MKTVFKVDGQGFTISGVGQAAVSAILKTFPTKKVFLVGFINENNEFIKAEL